MSKKRSAQTVQNNPRSSGASSQRGSTAAAPTTVGRNGPPPPAQRTRWLPFLAAGVIALATLATYSNTFRSPFIFDDELAILENPTIRHLGPLGALLTPPAHGEAVQRRPVVNISLALNYAISGTNVWSYHVFNWAAHVLAAWLLFGVVRRTLLLPGWSGRWSKSSTALAFVVAVFWAVHPLLTEAVTYVVQRTEVLAGLFYLLTLYGVLRGAQFPHALRWYAAAVAACALAMGSKETAVSAPLVVLLYDRVFLSASWSDLLRRRWGLYLALAATWSVILIMLPYGQEKTAIFGQPGQAFDYALAQPAVLVHYLRLCFWPHPLLVDYGVYTPSTASQIIPAALAIAALLMATLLAFRYQPWLGFLGVWFFAILAPSSSVIPLFQQIAAEKRMYLPLAAVVTCIVLGVARATQWLIQRRTLTLRTAQVAAGSLVVCVGVALGCATFTRNSDYSTAVAIWQNTVAQVPPNARAQNNYGRALADSGQFDQAIACYTEALKLDANFSEAYSNLGHALLRSNRIDDAVVALQTALQLNPHLAEAHNNLGHALFRRGQQDEALAHYRTAVALRPTFAEAHNNLANALARQGQIDEALAEYQRVLDLQADLPEVHFNYGSVLAKCGRREDARTQYRLALPLASAQGKTALVEAIRVRLAQREASSRSQTQQTP